MSRQVHSVSGFRAVIFILCSATAGWAVTFSGKVFEGNVGEEGKPLSGVTVSLYGSNNRGQQGNWISQDTTDAQGYYDLESGGIYEFYNIIETDPSGYFSVGATTVGGSKVSDNWIEYEYPLGNKTLSGNKFWDKKEDQPENHPPVANAGPDQSIPAGSAAQLDGSGSSDADGDPLTYHWSLLSVPAGSSAGLSNPTAVGPTFVADRAGTYVAQLIVNDGKVDSSPDTVTITAVAEPSRTGTLKGYKWNDLDKDGTWDGGEPGLAGWPIDLWYYQNGDFKTWVHWGSTTTDAGGAYAFELCSPGEYQVREGSLGGNWTCSSPPGGDYGVTLSAGEVREDLNFGNYQTETPPPTETQACCFADGTCANLTPEQCRQRGGTPKGPGTACWGDTNGDGIDDVCGGQPPAGAFDFGDAPRPYPTLHADGGAYHDVNPALCLGASIDVDLDGQPDATAAGDDSHGADDEDGVTFTSSLQPGAQAAVRVVVSSPPCTYVNVTGWIDFNGDGQWQDPQERIFSTSTWAPVTLTETFTVPANARTGVATCARFRLWRAAPGADFLPSPTGYGGDGEVEDYQVQIGREAPPTTGQDYTFRLCFEAEIDVPGIGLVRTTLTGLAQARVQVGANGQASDTNGNGRDDASAELVDLGLTGMDPLVGAVRLILNPCRPSLGQVEEQVNTTPGVLDIEPFTATGSADSFFDVFFQVELPDLGICLYNAQPKRLGGVIDSLVPAVATYTQGSSAVVSLVRGPCMTMCSPGLDPTRQQPLPAPAAFLYSLTACDQAPPGQEGYDYGDAPRTYPTLLAQNGARHTSGGPWLGMAPPDTEPDGQPESNALGDDTQGIDDEDGLGFMTAVVPGQFTWVGITFSGPGQELTYAVWVDWNQNGQWEDPAERYTRGNMNTLPALPLSVVVANPVPLSARPGTTFARVRVYQGRGVPVSPTGDGGPGEVEDFKVDVRPTGAVVRPGHVIAGIKFHDLDGDGNWDPLDGESRLANWTIWLDTNNDGTPDKTTQTDSLGEFEFASVQPGTYTLGEQQQAGWTQTAPAGGGTYTFTVPDGLQPTITFGMFGNRRTRDDRGLDYGDAPDPTYPTLRSSNGAYHVIVPGLSLGQGIDGEANGQPSPDAMGDDSAGDDEDGVLFTTPLLAGQPAVVEVFASAAGKLDAWIDFDNDGGWTQGSDQVFNSYSLPAGGSVLTFTVPAGGKSDGPAYARFRLSTKGGLSFNGPAPDGEVEDYALRLGPEGPYPPGRPPAHVKWSQPPIEIDPDVNAPRVFCGWDEPASSTKPGVRGARSWNTLVDDFHCLGPIPITSVRWWGSYQEWDSLELPDEQPDGWQISFWVTPPADTRTRAPATRKLVWQVQVPPDRVRVEPIGPDRFPEHPADQCFLYELRLEPQEFFWQSDLSTVDGVFLISIVAVYPDGVRVPNPWGWKTRPVVWGAPASGFTLTGDGPQVGFTLNPSTLTPLENDLLCGETQGYDLCFSLLTDDPWVKWDQPFTGLRDWPYYEDLESQGTSIRQQETIGRLVADDWIGEWNTPVIAAAWWGSYLGHGYEACQCGRQLDPPRPDYFLLRLWQNVPASRTAPAQPGAMVWEYRAFEYDEVLVGYDKNPEGEPNEPVYRYAVRLPEGDWFRQEVPGTVYWFSVAAVYTDPLPRLVHPWGWTNHSFASASGAVFIDYLARPRPEWRLLRDPLDRPMDMSFTLFTLPQE